MDPNTTLQTARDAVRELQKPPADPMSGYDPVEQRQRSESTEQLAEAFDKLDTWLQKGGMLPTSWL